MKIRVGQKAPAQVMWGIAQSPVGKVAVGVTAAGEVCRVGFLRARKAAEVVAEWQAEWANTEFSSGADLENVAAKPVLLVGTAFQQDVWRAMTKIPAGQVRTYGEIARRIGRPKAVRAVGTACGANPVPYLIPCHRVVAATSLGGFSSGLEIKKMLLRAEGYL